MPKDPTIDDVLAVTFQIEPLLAGRHPAVQGAVLAHLLSKWLMGHQADAATRERLLAMHIDTVREMMAVAS